MSSAGLISADPRLEYAAVPAGDQILEVDVSGPGVELFETHAGPAPADPDLVTPDPLVFLVKCARLGFFPTAEGLYEPGPEIEILDAKVDPAARRQVWRVRFTAVHPGALRVLACTLLARDLARVAIRTLSTKSVRIGIEARPPAFPPPLARGPFGIMHETPAVAERDRLVQLELVRAPRDEELEAIYALFADWVTLLCLGAYPPDHVPPSRSGAIPELAALTDRTTIEQTFNEAFVCHEDSFHAILGGLASYHRSVLHLARVTIR